MEQTLLYNLYISIPWAMILVSYTAIFVDLFYGVLVSCLLKEVKSRKMLKGLKSKVFVLFVPIMGVLIKAFFILCNLPSGWEGTEDVHHFFGVDNLSDFPICFFMCGFVILMEAYSFLENSAKIDGFAKKILAIFDKQAKEEIENGQVVNKIFRRS